MSSDSRTIYDTGDYVPSFPKKQATITARELAGHLSGIRHYRIPGDPIGNRSYKSLEEGLQIFAADTLLFTPGTRYSYSSYGYNLLGVALEGAVKSSYIAVVRAEVLRPIGMWSTALDCRDSIVPNRATPYDYGKDQRVINAPYDDVSYKWPSAASCRRRPTWSRLAWRIWLRVSFRASRWRQPSVRSEPPAAASTIATCAGK